MIPLAVILAGGRATRMGGGDKGLRLLDGRPLLAHVIARLRPQVETLVLNANGDPARFAAFGLPVVPDPLPGQPGPLAGVLAAMEHAATLGAGRVLTAPTDTPDLPPDLAARLAETPPEALAVAASGGRDHPTVALWPSSLASDLRAFLGAGERRVRAFIARHPHRVTEWPTHPADPFRNINTSDELTP